MLRQARETGVDWPVLTEHGHERFRWHYRSAVATDPRLQQVVPELRRRVRVARCT